jgi:hypothetical protein
MVEKHPSMDYFIIPPAPLPAVGVSFGETDMSLLFHRVRNHAFEEGDRTAVGLVYRLLNLKIKTMSAAGLDGLENQITQEFGYSVEELRQELDIINGVFHDLQKVGA